MGGLPELLMSSPTGAPMYFIESTAACNISTLMTFNLSSPLVYAFDDDPYIIWENNPIFPSRLFHPDQLI